MNRLLPQKDGEIIAQPITQPTKIKRVIADLDGTLYDVVGMYYPNGFESGFMCQSNPCWVIISGYDKTVYAFTENRYISPDYIKEKLCPKGSLKDAENLLKAINAVMEAE